MTELSFKRNKNKQVEDLINLQPVPIQKYIPQSLQETDV